MTPFVSAEAWVAVDAASGVIIGGHRHHDKRCVASMTKILTAAVVLGIADLDSDCRLLNEVP
jgi:D-alanyl-D-alanine carboxypeptidase